VGLCDFARPINYMKPNYIMDKNIEYEKFTQDIYQSLINEEGLTINVQHNVRLQGKATKHQIDVFWEYKIAGVNNKVAIECKNYNREISIGKVRDFHGVLFDIGNINGIMVTKKGYQKGAKDFAELHGIKLIILREPIDDDWKGRIKIIETTIEAITTEVINWKIELDLEWIKANFPLEQLQNFEFKVSGMNNEIWIIDNENKKFKNLLQLQDELPFNENEKRNLKHFNSFDNGYIQTEKYGKLKIKEIHFIYNIHSSKSKFIIDGRTTAKAIVKDVLSGDLKFVRPK
jgi:hypothetical protein